MSLRLVLLIIVYCVPLCILFSQIFVHVPGRYETGIHPVLRLPTHPSGVVGIIRQVVRLCAKVHVRLRQLWLVARCSVYAYAAFFTFDMPVQQ